MDDTHPTPKYFRLVPRTEPQAVPHEGGHLTGAVVFGHLVIVLLAVTAIIAQTPLALLALAFSAAMAYANYAALLAAYGGHVQVKYRAVLVRAANVFGVLCVLAAASVAVGLYGVLT